MGSFINLGRYLLAMTMAGFGIQHYLYAIADRGPAPGPPWIVGSAFWACVVGGTLIVAGVSLVAGKNIALPAALLGGALVVYVLVLYFPSMVIHPRNPYRWTSSSELLAMCGAVWVLAGSRRGEFKSQSGAVVADSLVIAGRFLFGFSLAVFAVQHFLYARFTATMVPAWMPWRLFWACFVGAAFLAAGVSIATKMQARLASMLLALMFFLIVVMIHAQRVAASLQDGSQWTSALVAVAMVGASLVVAEAFRPTYRIISKSHGKAA